MRRTPARCPPFCRPRAESPAWGISVSAGNCTAATANMNVFWEVPPFCCSSFGVTVMDFKTGAQALSLLLVVVGNLGAIPDASISSGDVAHFNVESSTAAISTVTWRTVPHAVLPPSEELFFVVKWGLVTAGYSSLSIKGIEAVQGRPAYHLVSEARSGGMVTAFYRVVDRNVSWLDQESIVSVRFEKHIKEGKFQIDETTFIDQPHRRFHLQSYRLDIV